MEQASLHTELHVVFLTADEEEHSNTVKQCKGFAANEHQRAEYDAFFFLQSHRLG